MRVLYSAEDDIEHTGGIRKHIWFQKGQNLTGAMKKSFFFFFVRLNGVTSVFIIRKKGLIFFLIESKIDYQCLSNNHVLLSQIV